MLGDRDWRPGGSGEGVRLPLTKPVITHVLLGVIVVILWRMF